MDPLDYPIFQTGEKNMTTIEEAVAAVIEQDTENLLAIEAMSDAQKKQLDEMSVTVVKNLILQREASPAFGDGQFLQAIIELLKVILPLIIELINQGNKPS